MTPAAAGLPAILAWRRARPRRAARHGPARLVVAPLSGTPRAVVRRSRAAASPRFVCRPALTDGVSVFYLFFSSLSFKKSFASAPSCGFSSPSLVFCPLCFSFALDIGFDKSTLLKYTFLVVLNSGKEIILMAKVKGPLMSMGASGQLGKSLVFMTWKGIKDVRSHVVPANPKTDLQKAQRAIMTSAVAAWHSVVFNDLDLEAFRVLASVQSMIMSGFNAFCKLFIKYTLLEYAIVQPYAMEFDVEAAGSLGISISAPGTVAASVKYGGSPSVMGSTSALTKANTGDPYTVTLTGFTVDQYVYLQIYTEVAETFILTGIYKVFVTGLPTP